MKSEAQDHLAPILYIPHGGGPLPLLGDREHQNLINFLKRIPSELGEPLAILVISAHWEEEMPTIIGAKEPGIMYDYFGFPPEAYTIQYPVAGNFSLAQEIYDRLETRGIQARLDQQRGFDHGVFVPLKLMYPEASISCVQLSLIRGLNPTAHIELGKSLAALRKENILIIGSGFSFHNLRAFFSSEPHSVDTQNIEFDQWLIDTCTNESLSPTERERRLLEWESAPFARYCHPREEHLLPLHVCFGIASVGNSTAKVVFNQDVMGKRATALLWL